MEPLSCCDLLCHEIEFHGYHGYRTIGDFLVVDIIASVIAPPCGISGT